MALAITHAYVAPNTATAQEIADGKVIETHWNAALVTSMATNKVLGRTTAGTGAIEELATTGSGSVVLATAPTLVTPVLGVASATSINKVALTAPATGATLTLVDGKTLTVNKSLTLEGTDSTTMTFPSVSADIPGLAVANTFAAAQTVLRAAIGASTTDGVILSNTTAAAAGAQQWSPRTRWTGQGWKTDSGGASQATDWIAENVPIQGAAAPTTALRFSSQVNAGGYAVGVQFIGTTAYAASMAAISNSASPTNSRLAQMNTTGFGLASGGQFGWVSSSSDVSGAQDTILTRSAPAAIQQGAANAASPVAQTLQAQGSRTGTDSDVAGASYTIRPGKGTGNAAPGALILQGYVAVASGTGAQTATTHLSIAAAAVTVADAIDFAFNATTGTKLGTAASQKLAFWAATPIVQPTTGVAAATFVANTSLIANDTATFDGYTLGQVVKALRNEGLLA